MRELSTNDKGAIAEAAITAAAVKVGIFVLRPMQEGRRYDLLFDVGGRLVRVQCKWGHVAGDVIKVRVGGCRHTPGGYVRSVYSDEEVDAIAVYAAALDRCYLVPIELAAGKSLLHLRLAAARNGQRAAVTMAEKYQLGAVAQLEARRRGTAEVTGSNPVSSTPSSEPTDADDPPLVVGAHVFRNHFGYYLELAAGGRDVSVTRHGKPLVRLVSERPGFRAA